MPLPEDTDHMAEDTQTLPLFAPARDDAMGSYRVDDPREVHSLLRHVRDAIVPVQLNAPGASYTSTLWVLDDTRERLIFSAEEHAPQLPLLVDADEVVAVAFLESVKLQFELHGLTLVHGANSCVLQAEWPSALYRFQRRSTFRVSAMAGAGPTVMMLHPADAKRWLSLRVIDVSIGGCALHVPSGEPMLPMGALVEGVKVELDNVTRFTADLQLHHLNALPSSEQGVRLGCEWVGLTPAAERVLQRYIDQTQKHRRRLVGG